jgi:hypothetical protein
MSAPKNYRSFAEFQREEIRPDQDAELRMSDGNFEEREPEELDFG